MGEAATGRRRTIIALIACAVALLGCVISGVVLVVVTREPSVRDQVEAMFADVGELDADARTMLRYADDEAAMALARRLYFDHCRQCHGLAGQGMAGPNLTDELYISVRRVEDIYDVIANGRNHGAMPAQRGILTRNEMVLLSAYVAGLRGTHARNPRPADPRAIPIDPWPTSQE